MMYLYAEYIMWNAGLDESLVGIKIAERNINNLKYTDDRMAESEEELKSRRDSTEPRPRGCSVLGEPPQALPSF